MDLTPPMLYARLAGYLRGLYVSCSGPCVLLQVLISQHLWSMVYGLSPSQNELAGLGTLPRWTVSFPFSHSEVSLIIDLG